MLKSFPLLALLACSPEEAASKAPKTSSVLTEQRTRVKKHIYLADSHIQLDPNNPISRATQKLQYQVVSDELKDHTRSFALVQEGTFTEEALSKLYGIKVTYSPEIIELLFGGEHRSTWNFGEGIFAASPRLLLENKGRLQLIGTETAETWKITGEQADAFWETADYLEELKTCPTSKKLPFPEVVRDFQRGSNAPAAVDCYCTVRAQVLPRTTGFENDRLIDAAGREAEAALVSTADTTFIIAGINHYNEIQRRFDAKKVPLESHAPEGVKLGEVERMDMLPDRDGICAHWISSH